MHDNKLNHIAIIMDGNGRWAKMHSLPISLGHKKGAEAAKNTILNCLKIGIPYLTLYTFSSENWHRKAEEVESLLSLLKFYLVNELEFLIANKVKVKIIGNKDKFSSDIVKLINDCENATESNDGLFLQLALSYGAKEEIIQAQKKLLFDFKMFKIKEEELSEQLFEQYLYTANIPDPDLLIRTSGEARLSNFLLWQLAYTELYFTKILWPDFNMTQLRKAINSYYKRERRYGLSK
jgi:undecaprenyl diphosphate synthase